jgi:hypothetical protein
MHAKQLIRENLDLADKTTVLLLEGLSDDDLLVRSVPGANHVNWMLGHLVASENQMVDWVKLGVMPALPAGFAERYDPKRSQIEDLTGWVVKDELLRLMREQRAGTLRALEATTDAELAAPGPEFIQSIVQTNAGIFELVAAHWQNHTGQWSVVRRKLGKPHAF